MLCDRQIKNLTATGKPYRLREKSTDQSLRGFGVQVSAAGTKTFYMEYSFGGQRGHFYRLGAYPGLSLAQARERCREVRNLVDQGIDPKVEFERRRTSEVVERKAQEQQALEARATATYEDLVRVYLESLDNATTRREIDRLLHKDARPILKGKRVTEIETSDIRAVLAKARQRGAKRVVFMLHSYLHAAFVYAIGEQEIDGLLFPLTSNPVAAVKKPDSGHDAVQPRPVQRRHPGTLARLGSGCRAPESHDDRGDPTHAAHRPAAPGDPAHALGSTGFRRGNLVFFAGTDQDEASASASPDPDDHGCAEGHPPARSSGLSAFTASGRDA